MNLDYFTLEQLRQKHPAWRLLRSDHAPLIAGFLHRVFIMPNLRAMAQADLAEALEDELYRLRKELGEGAFPKSALEYLNDWTAPERGWLRKFYPTGSDEPHFDLTPATEKAIAWLSSLAERQFVGTESRLLTLFALLQQMSVGTETDPAARIAELNKRKAELEAEIDCIQAGDLPLLDDTALRDRFQQFTQLARELLSDFREVEHNFRGLDRRVRERIACWAGNKGELLEEIMGERDAIADSDQGKSFRAFWDFLMSSRRQEELTRLLEKVMALPPVAELKPDSRTRRIHYDWLEAGEHTQRTVAQLSQQLRRFLDDQAWLENRRIMDILHGIEAAALSRRDSPPSGLLMEFDAMSVAIDLPMERPLYPLGDRAEITAAPLADGDMTINAAALFSPVVVDKPALVRHIRQSLQGRERLTLRELVAARPLRQGLAELVAYLQMAAEQPLPSSDTTARGHSAPGPYRAMVDESVEDEIAWATPKGEWRKARLPRVIFMR